MYIEVGQIVNTHALKGEVKVNPWTDAPEVFECFDRVCTADGKSFDIESIKYQKACVILKLSGVNSIDDAEKMRGKILSVPRNTFENLPDDTYLVADIIGLTVKDNDTEYGKIADVITTGSNDVYVVKRDGAKDLLIPAIKSVVKDINIGGGYVLVEMPKGLIDGDKK